MSWDKDIEELRRREALAEQMGGADRVARQNSSGKLTARERVDALLDRGSFHETGKIAGKAEYGPDNQLASFRATPFVIGRGEIDGRPVCVQSDDFSVRGGAADAGIWQKLVFAEQMANEYRMPLVRMVDGTGGGGPSRCWRRIRARTFRRLQVGNGLSQTWRASPWWRSHWDRALG
jgi:propionyl-CoA carboxylase beta chain